MLAQTDTGRTSDVSLLRLMEKLVTPPLMIPLGTVIHAYAAQIKTLPMIILRTLFCSITVPLQKIQIYDTIIPYGGKYYFMIQQKYLKKGGLLAFVTVLGMAPPLSTDMYMPSLPLMAEYFNVETILANLTLVVFFLFMALGMLFFGPVSDKAGRKKPLLISLSLYAGGSLLCSLSFSIWLLIGARCIQAAGAGGMVSLSLAIIKDCFIGKTRDTALAAVQSMSVIAPIASPVIGAMILKFAAWRMVFIVLFIIAALLLLTGFLYQESIHEEERNGGSIMDSIKRMAVIGKNRNFMPFLLSVSFYAAPFMAYLAVASYTYEEFFGLSAARFSLFFAINAAFSVLGPVAYIFLFGKMQKRSIMHMLLGAGGLFSILLLLFGERNPVIFLCCFIPYGISNSMMRPYSTSILLDQQDKDAGSASALLNFANTFFGSIGMLIGSLPWHSYVYGLGITMLSFTAVSAAIWAAVLHSKKIRMKGIHVLDE